MKRIATLLALLALAAAPAYAANAVRISQAYGGGGGGSGTYLFDYVELFNNGATNVNIGGWVLEYGSATGNWGSTAINIFTFPANTMIQPCQYMLIQLGTMGTAGVALPVTPDFVTTNLSMSQSNGKVALFNAVNANVACGSETPGTIVDKVAWGTVPKARRRRPRSPRRAWSGTTPASRTRTTTRVTSRSSRLRCPGTPRHPRTRPAS